MDTKKAPEGAERRDKDTNYSTTYRVLQIFLSGQKCTAHGLNIAVGFNDARKAISLLRAKGYPIIDKRLIDMRKVYYLPDNWEAIMESATKCKQLDLFGNGD